jgi:hypothetical protein
MDCFFTVFDNSGINLLLVCVRLLLNIIGAVLLLAEGSIERVKTHKFLSALLRIGPERSSQVSKRGWWGAICAGRVNAVEAVLTQELQKRGRAAAQVFCSLVALHWARQNRNCGTGAALNLPLSFMDVLKATLARPATLVHDSGAALLHLRH